MASLESAPVTFAGAGVGAASRLMRGVSAVFAAAAQWRTSRDTRRQLHRLTDSELEDIGLSRWDIDRRF